MAALRSVKNLMTKSS